MFQMQQNTEVRIKHFLLTQSGTYQEQTIRPFTTTVSESMLNQLEVATRGGRNVGIGAVQEVAAQMIKPSTTPEGVVNIENGWRARRFRFMMHVEERHPFSVGENINRIYFGSTDQCDASINYLDPNMRIYFNSETIITEMQRNTPNGPVRQAIVSGSNQIISPIDMMGRDPHGLYNRAHSHLIRPEDVFSMGQSLHTADMLESTNQFPGGIQVVLDARTMVGMGGHYKYSKRRDTSPARYLSSSLDAYQNAVKEAALQSGGMPNEGLNMEVVYGQAQGFSSNQDITSNTFFSRLKDHAGYMEKGYITYRELCTMFPEAADPSCMRFALDNGRSVRQVNFAEQANHWNGSDDSTIAASLLGQVVPAAMMDNFIRTISFAATNGVGHNQYLVEPHAQMITMLVNNMDAVNHINEFIRRMMVDVLGVVSRGNQIPFRMSVFADLTADTVIDIELGNEGLRRYVVPTFTDSLFSPVITRNDQALRKITSDILHVVQESVPTAQVAHSQPSFTSPTPVINVNPNIKSTIAAVDGFGLL